VCVFFNTLPTEVIYVHTLHQKAFSKVLVEKFMCHTHSVQIDGFNGYMVFLPMSITLWESSIDF
jgi:hypothetical protein